MNRLKAAALAAGLGVGMAAAAIVATPGAAMAWGNCPPNRLCIYFDPDGNGYKFELAGSVPFLGAFDDQISAVDNNTPYPACLYQDPDYNGDYLYIAPFERRTLQFPFDDKVSSISYNQCGG